MEASLVHTLRTAFHVKEMAFLQACHLNIKAIVHVNTSETFPKTILTTMVYIEHRDWVLFLKLLEDTSRYVINSSAHIIVLARMLLSLRVVEDFRSGSITDDSGPLDIAIEVFACHRHHCHQGLHELQFCLLRLISIIGGLFIVAIRLLTLLLVRIDHLLEWKSGAHLVAHAYKVFWIVHLQLSAMLEQHTGLVVDRFIVDVLNCVKCELIVQALDEVIE